MLFFYFCGFSQILILLSELKIEAKLRLISETDFGMFFCDVFVFSILGIPTVVKTNILIRSMGPVSELDMVRVDDDDDACSF